MFKKNKAQVSLEIGLSLVCLFLLLFASLSVFLWANQRFITRQTRYESTRITAGSANDATPRHVDDSDFPRLDLSGGMK